MSPQHPSYHSELLPFHIIMVLLLFYPLFQTPSHGRSQRFGPSSILLARISHYICTLQISVRNFMASRSPPSIKNKNLTLKKRSPVPAQEANIETHFCDIQHILPQNIRSELQIPLGFCITEGFPCGSTGKESACNAGDLGLIPGLEISLKKGKATHSCSGLENFMDCTVHGFTKSQTRLRNFHFSVSLKLSELHLMSKLLFSRSVISDSL